MKPRVHSKTSREHTSNYVSQFVELEKTKIMAVIQQVVTESKADKRKDNQFFQSNAFFKLPLFQPVVWCWF